MVEGRGLAAESSAPLLHGMSCAGHPSALCSAPTPHHVTQPLTVPWEQSASPYRVPGLSASAVSDQGAGAAFRAGAWLQCGR